jgi:hypothetical protein
VELLRLYGMPLINAYEYVQVSKPAAGGGADSDNVKLRPSGDGENPGDAGEGDESSAATAITTVMRTPSRCHHRPPRQRPVSPPPPPHPPLLNAFSSL